MQNYILFVIFLFCLLSTWKITKIPKVTKPIFTTPISPPHQQPPPPSGISSHVLSTIVVRQHSSPSSHPLLTWFVTNCQLMFRLWAKYIDCYNLLFSIDILCILYIILVYYFSIDSFLLCILFLIYSFTNKYRRWMDHCPIKTYNFVGGPQKKFRKRCC